MKTIRDEIAQIFREAGMNPNGMLASLERLETFPEGYFDQPVGTESAQGYLRRIRDGVERMSKTDFLTVAGTKP